MNVTRVFKILVIEDNVHFADFLKDKLAAEYELEVIDNAEAALQKFQPEAYDLVLLDLGLPRRPGLPPEIIGFEILKSIKMIDPTVEVIVLTGATREIDSAIQAIKDGAYHFLIKDDYEVFAEKLYTTIYNALEKRKLKRDNGTLRQQVQYIAECQKRVHKYQHPELNYHFGLLLGESEPMQEIYAVIQKLSSRLSEETIAIYGESGTGKELVALSIHSLSRRRERLWIVANIAALTPSIIESELFGIEDKIATTVRKRSGLFEHADGSSIFLDEIGDVSADIQVKLLRVLQEKEILRVGAARPIPVDVRIIVATNKNLEESVRQGKFREDLYFRLTIPIVLPPLRQRREDIPLLIQHVIYSIQQEEKNPALMLAPEAIALLQEYEWPGNIRQLENIIKRAVILRNQDTMSATDFRKLLPHLNSTIAANHTILERLPSLRDLSPPDEALSFKSIRDSRVRHKLLLRTLIEREGRMEEVLEDLNIARNTGYKFLEEAENFLLTGLCQMECNIKQLALIWGVEISQLERTLRRANRLSAYLLDLQKRFEHDLKRLAAFLNVKAEQLEKASQYLGGLQK
jgi:DNA-binding NtrC family response regulator